MAEHRKNMKCVALATWLVMAIVILSQPSSAARELVRNGSFDNGTEGWSATEGAVLDTNSYNGNGVKIERPDGGWAKFKQSITGIKPNTTYNVSFRVKADRRAIPKVDLVNFKPVSGDAAIWPRVGKTWQLVTWVMTSAVDCPDTVQLCLRKRSGNYTVYYDDVSVTCRDFVQAKVEQKTIPEVAREGQNLISNWDFEVVENRKAAGWFQNDKGVMAVTADGRYFTNPEAAQGECTIRSPGFQSKRAMAISVRKPGKCVELNTQVHNIKRATPYTISFWYRMPANDNLCVLLFGRELLVHRMYKYNPMHWCRYSEIINSGPVSGDVNIGLNVKSRTGDRRVWIDKVELYEGTSPIGNNVARLWYLYYGYAYVSPDMISALMFMHEWTFDSKPEAATVRYVVEFPAEVEPVSCALGGAWGNLMADYEVKQTEVEVDGKAYIRGTAYPKMKRREYVVPVRPNGKKKRDRWDYSFAGNCGRVNLCWYIKSKVKEGTYLLYYYAEWDGGRQPRQKMNLEVIRITKAGQPKRLLLMAGPQYQAFEKYHDMARDFLRVGLNGIDYWHSRFFKDGVAGMKARIVEYRQLGIKYFGIWMVPAMYYSSDPESSPMNMSGKRTSKPDKSHGGFAFVCMEYRGPDWTKNMNRLKKLVQQGVNVFKFDDCKRCTCYCPRCQALFAEFLKKHSKLEYIAPSVFMKADWKGNVEYKALWEDFSLWHYGKCAQVMKDELVAYARSQGIEGKIYFGISSLLQFKNAFAASSLSAFDSCMQQTYINCYTGTYEGSPKRVGDLLYEQQKKFGKYALPLLPTLEPGLTYMHPVCCLDPYAQMKYQILEAAMAPKFAGYVMYDGKDTDLGDLKCMGEANAILIRFEDLLMDGEALEPIEINDYSCVRIKKLGKEALVLVSDYSTYEVKETVVKFSSTELDGWTLEDVETGKKIVPDGNLYTVRIMAERARVFHAEKPRPEAEISRMKRITEYLSNLLDYYFPFND